MSEIVKLANADAVIQEAARRWIAIANQSVAERGRFTIALSGGNTPAPLYRLMTSDEYRGQVAWDKTHVFWSDERRVPASHPDSNFRMARETLLDYVPIPSDQIYRMPTEGLTRIDADHYERVLRKVFDLKAREWPRFDLMLLGMGKDGHVASIFPGTRAVSDLSAMVLVYEVPQLRSERMTLTLPVLNNARNVILLVTGGEKAEMLAEVLGPKQQPSTRPAEAVKPVDGSLVWLVDQEAGGQSESK